MNSYLITYDLISPGQNYTKITAAIKALGSSCRCLESVWIIKHWGTSETIRNKLAAHIDSNDKLLVVKLAGDHAESGLTTEVARWLKTNL